MSLPYSGKWQNADIEALQLAATGMLLEKCLLPKKIKIHNMDSPIRITDNIALTEYPQEMYSPSSEVTTTTRYKLCEISQWRIPLTTMSGKP